jgi:putative transposase
MSIRKVPFTTGEYYHIYNRGNSKQTIFHDKKDYDRFVKLLFLSNSRENFKVHLLGKEIYDHDRGEPLVGIGAYCLMPNHFHLLLTQTETGSISKFMQKVSTGYSMYHNNRYKRTGTLFEGKFKSEHSDNDRYLKYLFSYIHLNPIKLIDTKWKENGIKDKSNAIKYIENYYFSSFPDYSGLTRKERDIINPKLFPDYFSHRSSFKEEIFSWLDYHADLPGKTW